MGKKGSYPYGKKKGFAKRRGSYHYGETRRWKKEGDFTLMEKREGELIPTKRRRGSYIIKSKKKKGILIFQEIRKGSCPYVKRRESYPKEKCMGKKNRSLMGKNKGIFPFW